MSKYAVVVGIGDYRHHDDYPNVFAAEADADAIAHLLVDAFGFDRNDVTLLRNASATRKNILSALRFHAGRAAAGDVICFYFAGHGGVVPATDAEDNTRYHESIVPYLGEEIFDVEIADLVDTIDLNDVNLTFLLDSCHSGGAHPSDAVEQAMPRSVRFDPEVWDWIVTADEWHPFGLCLTDGSTEFFPNVRNLRIEDNRLVDLDEDRDKTLVDAPVATLFAACRYYETAWAGASHGHFTQAILDTVTSPRFEISHRDFIDRVGRRTTELSGGTQHPILRGQAGRSDETLLHPWNHSIPQ